MDFQRFIRKHISGLKLLPISTEQYVPGVILDAERLRFFGHCRDVLPEEPESTWTFSFTEANMIYGSLSSNRKMRSGLSILGLFSLRGGFGHDLSVHFDVADVRGAYLNTNQLTLQPRINALRSIDRRGRWRLVNNKLVVLETFYASEVCVTFYKNNEVMTQAELEELSRLDVRSDIEYRWKGGRELVISRNSSVPFGVRGFIV
ncbi:MAG: hypothetical protein R6U86_02180 [Bacteroidales bacterium]